MTKVQFKKAAKEKFAEWFDPKNEKYQQRQKWIKQQEQHRSELNKSIQFYSYSSFGDEALGNMKAVIILIFILCGVIPIFL